MVRLDEPVGRFADGDLRVSATRVRTIEAPDTGTVTGRTSLTN
jgi:hypothetical protein